MSKLKVGLIGCGKQAPKHISGFREDPKVEVYLADLVPELAQSLAESQGLTWIEQVEQMLEDPGLDAVDICTPTPSHYPLIKAALERGKHVFCEKPLCETIEQAHELRELAKKNGHFVQTGYIYRHAPVFTIGHKLMEGNNPPLGRPVWGLFRIGGRGSHKTWKHMRATGGGAISEMLVHMLDLANWLCGPVKDLEVVKSTTLMKSRTIEGEKILPDTEDFILLRGSGHGGMELIIQGDFVTPAFSQYVELQGDNGSFMGSIVPGFSSFLFLQEARGGFEQGRQEIQFGPLNLFNAQMCSFLEAVRSGKQPTINTIEDSIVLMEMIHNVRIQAGD